MFVQFLGVLVAVSNSSPARPHLLDGLLVLPAQEHHNGVILGVVQAVHMVGGHVKYAVLLLKVGKKEKKK